jgi:hypothetical protein
MLRAAGFEQVNCRPFVKVFNLRYILEIHDDFGRHVQQVGVDAQNAVAVHAAGVAARLVTTGVRRARSAGVIGPCVGPRGHDSAICFPPSGSIAQYCAMLLSGEGGPVIFAVWLPLPGMESSWRARTAPWLGEKWRRRRKQQATGWIGASMTRPGQKHERRDLYVSILIPCFDVNGLTLKFSKFSQGTERSLPAPGVDENLLGRKP